MSFEKLGVVGSVPAPGTTPGTGDAADALRVVQGNVLVITGANPAGASGTLTLMRWFPPPRAPVPDGFKGQNIDALGEWRPWREDAPIQVAAGPSFFSGRYEFGHDSAEYWLLLSGGGLAADDVTADAQGVYYRRTR